ncbi:MAG TPA: serine hydrolase [Terriglobales bacterium]|nr:serine hydrolase [Terriglobales bacterium]
MMTKGHFLSRILIFVFFLQFPASASWAQSPISGFTASSAARENEIEQKFKAIPDPQEERRQHRIFTAEPHLAGSKRNNDLANYVADEWRKQGLEDVVLRRYDVYATEPKSTFLEMVAPTRYRASLREEPYEVDPDTRNPRVSSAWTGMSISGEVTAPVVYAHSGNPEDYDLLRKNGIDVKGKIVLVRYSNPYSYRGFKALTAQREGAAAMLVYSDPAEDGYKKGKVFPDGPWGPESHIQRGAITYDFMVPGDPLTPGWASVPGAKRIPLSQAVSVPKIMALPLSWKDAKPIIENLGGPIAPPDWQGGLPLEYHLGGERARVHLKIQMDNSIKPYYVVEGRIRGSELPDEWVVMGNHRDAWVYGGVDPSSGTASMMEMTRALGQLAKNGMRPRRTIVVCSWDGEEVGLTGSTEWGEQLADDLRKNAVAYINVDSSTSGSDFDGSAVASLAPMLVEASRSLQDPSGKSLYDAWKESAAKKKAESKEGAEVSDYTLADTRIGSGSDHTVFLNFVGMPVLGLTFDGPYGVYHSMYDDFYWMNHVGDPGYRYHTLMSQLWGVLGLRLANANVLPFDFASYGNNIRDFVHDVAKGKDLNQLDLKPLLDGIDRFAGAGVRLNHSLADAVAEGSLSSTQADTLNRGMMQVERNWLNPEGIPGRPWFKHMLYGARYTYAHLELPGLTEAVEKQDWSTAKLQAQLLQQALAKNAVLLDQLNLQIGVDNKNSLSNLQAQIEQIRSRFPGDMSVYMKNLATGDEIALDSDKVFETFSVIKLAIASELLHQVEAGKFSLSERIPLKAGDERLPSGVLYALDPGLSPTVKDLLTLMIIISDNEATDLLADKVGRENVTAYMHSLGLTNTATEFSDLDFDRKTEGILDPSYLHASGDQTVNFPFSRYCDQQAQQAFGQTIDDPSIYFGHSTTHDIGRLLEMMVKGKLVSRNASQLILSIMEKQQVNDRFPRYLQNVRLAHKTGDGQPFIANDAGVMWVNGEPIVLVVFTGHHRGPTAPLHESIARIAGSVAKYYGGQVTADFDATGN